MKTDLKTILKIATPTLFLGLLLGWVFFGSSENTKMDTHEPVEVKVETYFTCSMHPQIRQNEPGNCPICGMELIPIESDGGEEPDPRSITMSATAMQLANVSTAFVGKIDPVKLVRLNGKVQADERRIFSQSSHIPGRIEKLMVNFTGEFVNKGQIIAYIYSPDLMTAQEELFEANKIKQTQPQLFHAAKEKLKNWKLSEKQVEQILQSGKAKEEFAVLADVSGNVTEKMVNLGDYIRKGETLYEIANLSKVWILFDVYESDMAWIKKGNHISFTIQSLPGEIFQGDIAYLDPVIDSKTRVAKARIEFNNSSGNLKPEMFASGTVEAKLPKKTNTIVIPKTAVMWTGKRSIAYVKSPSEKGISFSLRNIILGPALGDSYIVEEGLEEGEEIAVNGTFSIDAAAQLAGKPSMMHPQGGQEITGHNHGMNMPEANEDIGKTEKRNIAINQNAKAALQPVYKEYLHLKDALVADNFTNAKKAGSNMQKELSGIKMSLFTGESNDSWIKYNNNLKTALKPAVQIKTMAEMRKMFEKVSETMIQLTKTFNPFEVTLYMQYCPMVNDNTGANWLSIDKEIRNPYFGKEMDKCGEIKITF